MPAFPAETTAKLWEACSLESIVKCRFFPHPFSGRIQVESLWMRLTRILG